MWKRDLTPQEIEISLAKHDEFHKLMDIVTNYFERIGTMRRLAALLLLCLFNILPSITNSQELPALKAQYLHSFGKNGSEPGEFINPTAISVDPKGNVYVADTGNNRIQKLDAYGRVIKFNGGFGWESEQFQRPLDICADNGLDVFVADYENRRIERYDKDLNWISSFYSDATLPEELRFGFPCGIAISIHSELFLVDDENYRVLKLNTERQPDLSFGDFDWGEGKLDQPCKVFVSRDDKVYISDQAAGRVVVFDYYGNYLTHWGDEVLSQPHGLCQTSLGHLLVTDWDNHRIVVFDTAGRVVYNWGSRGDKLGAFNHPADVACHGDKVYVVDCDNHRVQVFNLVLIK